MDEVVSDEAMSKESIRFLLVAPTPSDCEVGVVIEDFLTAREAYHGGGV